MKKLLAMLLCLFLALGIAAPAAAAAPEWPADVSVQAEGAIVMDADTGAILYGKNIHQHFYPASITKVLTALLAIENCSLDEIVTFSKDAVYNVESGSSNMAMETGDQLTVRDCLYGLMLASANEAANALAEHISGSREAFAVLMNEKAARLGCQNSNFSNPSGLNDENHYVSAYDMALICRAAINNDTFLEIDSTVEHDLPPTKRLETGQTIRAHHRMLKKNDPVYYPGIFGGKTGYTSLAGNTLVTFADRDGMKLIAVILNGGGTHYGDTKALLDFGFSNFQNLKIADYDTTYSSLENDMTIAGLPAGDMSGIYLEKSSSITLPKSADFSDVTSSISYALTDKDPVNAIAKLQYQYGDNDVGFAYLISEIGIEKEALPIAPVVLPGDESATVAEENLSSDADSSNPAISETKSPRTPGATAKKPFNVPKTARIVLAVIAAVAALIVILIAVKRHIDRKEMADRRLRRERRMRRLQDVGISSSEFDLLMEQRHTSSYTAGKKRRRRWKKFRKF